MEKTYALVTFKDDRTVHGVIEQTTTSPVDQVATRLWAVVKNEQIAAAVLVEAHEIHDDTAITPLLKWENVHRPIIRPEDLSALKYHFRKATEAGEDSFSFTNSKGYLCDLDTRYAHYLIEYLLPRTPKEYGGTA
jgi:hypothetical protein